MDLILCEKPAVGRDTARLLGIQEKREGYIVCNGGKVVTWAIGHLLQQDQPESYDPRYRHWSWQDLPIIPRFSRSVLTREPRISSKSSAACFKRHPRS